MSNPIHLLCEKSFLDYPEFRELVEDWALAFEDWERLGASGDDSLLIEAQRELVSSRAAEIMREHYPDISPEESVEPLVINNADLWAVRAMLLAHDMRRAAEEMEPLGVHDV